MIRLLFAGTPEVAVAPLRALADDDEHFEVVAVLTRPDAPRGRGRKLEPSPVKRLALELGIPVLEGDPNEPAFLTELKASGAQAAAVVAYGKILKEPVLEALPMGWYNLHFSLLPQWRGAAPVQRAIWAGDTLTGATVFRITKGMDSGPILAQSTLEIGPHDTSGVVLDRLSQDGSHLLASTLQAMAEDQIRPVDQPQGAYEVARKIGVEDAHIRFDVPAFAADRQIRACTPEPGAWCVLDTTDAATALDSTPASPSGETLHVLEARPADATRPETPTHLEPGRLSIGKRHVWVGTASEPLELITVKAQGKRAMAAADWARGARLPDTATCR
ncbi:methionyl-tRNA formyltransferase [Bifidobacterium mongoliense]|uniref:methionyl-tRNA formyltransferase n=2 Tax=Bifidobacterium mongoliense TaxID=518643 RepID=UPI0026473835|nr:methionyl-tRNA formyltransferase [Bifidobacterium mongoliense]MDN5980210.1 methionyl-tRNA formyltransferase [Bifidobacterium mongoliense]MDN6017673.1 methionyl-tRNA formyltransferase [Bifidobacterium mongoliense]